MTYLKTLRLEYLFSVLLPIILSIYINGYQIFDYIRLIGGWIFFGICGNLLNDIIDKDRDLEFSENHLLAMFFISLICGLMLMLTIFIDNLLNLLFFLTSAILVVLYCVKIKKYPIINKFVLVISHIIFPYLMVHIPNYIEPNFWKEIILLIGMFLFGVGSQIIHELSDKEAFQKYNKKIVRILVLSLAFSSVICFVYVIIIFYDIYLFPLITIPIGIIFLFRRPINPKPVHKKAGILVGNLILGYFLFLVF
ncbi:MAG: UbiA family prenyltransferase [Candidatus Helarchaeota archaeon]